MGALLLGGPGVVADVFDEFFNFPMFGVDVGALEDAWEEGGLPVRGTAGGVTSGAEGYKTREVLIFRAETVGDPRTEAWAWHAGFAAIHKHQRRLMSGDVGSHGADHEEVIGALGDLGEEIADFETALTVFLEGERRAEGSSCFAFGFEVFDRERLTVQAGEFGFGVEGVHVGRTAICEEVNEALGFSRKLRWARVQGGSVGERGVSGAGESGEAEHAEPHSAGLKEMAS